MWKEKASRPKHVLCDNNLYLHKDVLNVYVYQDRLVNE